MSHAQPIVDALNEVDSRSSSQLMNGRQKWLYSAWRLAALADSAGRVRPQVITFFRGKEDSREQGFSVGDLRLHGGLTNFSGSANQMPATESYIAKAFGVRFVTRPGMSAPRSTMHHLLNGSTRILIKKGDAVTEQFGPIELWPAGRFGLQSRSVAAIASPPAGGALTLVDYPQNGDAGLRVLEPGTELIFPAQGTINIGIEFLEEFYLTDNGEPASESNPVRDLWLQVLMDGFSGELVRF